MFFRNVTLWESIPAQYFEQSGLGQLCSQLLLVVGLATVIWVVARSSKASEKGKKQKSTTSIIDQAPATTAMALTESPATSTSEGQRQQGQVSGNQTKYCKYIPKRAQHKATTTGRHQGKSEPTGEDIGQDWEVIDKPYDPFVAAALKRREGRALNKSIEDLDTVFLPTAGGTKM